MLLQLRRRFLGELQNLFVQVLELAQEMKLLKVGRVCLDGTKIHANASKYQALSGPCGRTIPNSISSPRI